MKWALVTGASAGLGAEFAKLFAEQGTSVVIVARRRDRLEALAKQLRSKNSKVQVEVIEMDLCAPQAGHALAKELEQKKIEIEFLVNNAGFGGSGAFAQRPIEKELEMIDLNIRTLVSLCGELLPKMIARGSGRILNVGSTAGFSPGPYMATYYATKAFVNSFSEAIAEETRGTGVTVTVLAPGPVDTEFVEAAGIVKSSLFKVTAVGAEECARYGFEAMMKGESLAVHGLKFKALLQGMRLAPRAAVRRSLAMINRQH
ncbi:MAG: SDR family oxidoreductase [Bdellovibrionota bacterium]